MPQQSAVNTTNTLTPQLDGNTRTAAFNMYPSEGVLGRNLGRIEPNVRTSKNKAGKDWRTGQHMGIINMERTFDAYNNPFHKVTHYHDSRLPGMHVNTKNVQRDHIDMNHGQIL